MSMVPINSTAAPKRRKKNHSKTLQSRARGRARGDAFEVVSITSDRALYGEPGNHIAFGSTDQSGGESVAAATPIPIRSVAPADETQPFLEIESQSSNLEAAASDDYACLEDHLAHMGTAGDCFTPDTSENILQSQSSELRAYQLLQDPEPRMLKQEDEEMGAITAIDFDWPSYTPEVWSFGQSPTASSPETVFDFNPEVDIGSAPSVTKYPISDYRLPGLSPIFTDSADGAYADYPQLQQPRLSKNPAVADAFGWPEHASDEIDVILGRHIYDEYQDREPTDQKGAIKPLVSSCGGSDGRLDIFKGSVQISGISSPAQVLAGRKACRKRSSSRDDKGHSRLINCGRPYRDGAGQRLLACPFHKKDPQQHQICSKYTLRRIKDVKQHIYRHHCKPELYCPRCSQSFKCSNERDLHIRESGCILKEVPSFDGAISESQRKELKDCGSRGTSKQEQWTELWKVIFPGVNPPRSPYIENDQAELLSCLRSYWDENADQIISGSLGKRNLESVNCTVIRDSVNALLDRFEAKSTKWDISADGERGGISRQSPASDDWVMLNQFSPRDLDQLSEMDFASPAINSGMNA
ncbi:hypothetical protein F5X98DRAFT_377170 [Xylaria grammica]|nr:hypothetical protein F5X98DRAFT_377170 [Xylaria grammica]